MTMSEHAVSHSNYATAQVVPQASTRRTPCNGTVALAPLVGTLQHRITTNIMYCRSQLLGMLCWHQMLMLSGPTPLLSVL
mmetsp:Transcript_104888/g.208488  ORF Transcript_104888/g.208488 Transcript_104888/m.208488 type:complete len:80 (+) Transcript_104888:3-242(+)